MEIYLDNAATTRPHPAVVESVTRALTIDYGNPSSLHGKGLAAERLVAGARDAVARTLGVEPEDVLFTSGGTEANSLAIRGLAGLARGRHFVTTAVEHSSVRVPLQRLAAQEWVVTELPVDHHGRIAATQVEQALRPDTVLVSVMAVNNELGTMQPIEEISRVVQRHRAAGSPTLFHVDAVQMRALRDRLREQIGAIPDVRINPPPDGAAPHLVNATFGSVRGETLLHRLEQEGIFVSTGSACHSHSPTASHVLLAIGLNAADAQSTLRFSLSRFTTTEEIAAAAVALQHAVTELRALVR